MIKDTLRKKAPPYKTQAPTKNQDVRIWVAAKLNQLFIRGSSINF